jgi:hypothetical protein
MASSRVDKKVASVNGKEEDERRKAMLWCQVCRIDQEAPSTTKNSTDFDNSTCSSSKKKGKRRRRKRDDRIMEIPNRPFYRREVSRDYMQPESQEYSQGNGKEKIRERRTYHSSGRSVSEARDEREWSREKRASKNGRAIGSGDEW